MGRVLGRGLGIQNAKKFLAVLFYFFFLLISPWKIFQSFSYSLCGAVSKKLSRSGHTTGTFVGNSRAWLVLFAWLWQYGHPTSDPAPHTELAGTISIHSAAVKRICPAAVVDGDLPAHDLRRQHPVPSSSPALLEKGTVKIPTYHAWFTAAR